MSRIAWLSLMLAQVVHAQTPDDFGAWSEKYQFDCNAPFDHFKGSQTVTLERFTLVHSGATVKVQRSEARKSKRVVLGVLAGIKDLEPETRALLDRFIRTYEAADVDAVVVGGDSSAEPDVLDAILGYLVQATKRPILIIAGNMERGAALNYAVLKQRKAGALHLLNLGLIHRVDFDGLDVVSLSGYHDKAFLHLPGGCIYRDQDLDTVEQAAAACDDAVLLLTHGPPRSRGQKAIDYVPGADNVGDKRLTQLIAKSHIAFGISGHILEAAGHATDLEGRPIAPKTAASSLFFDPGSANPLPWKMNDGSTSYGLAGLMTVENRKASYEVLRGEKPHHE